MSVSNDFAHLDGFVERFQDDSGPYTVRLTSEVPEAAEILRRQRDNGTHDIAGCLCMYEYTTPNGPEPAVVFEIAPYQDGSADAKRLSEELSEIRRAFVMDTLNYFTPLGYRCFNLATYDDSDIENADFAGFMQALRSVKGVVNVWPARLEILEHPFGNSEPEDEQPDDGSDAEADEDDRDP